MTVSDRALALTSAFLDEMSEAFEGEPDYRRTVEEVARDVLTVEKASAEFASARVLARLSEPDRTIGFRVVWQDDSGRTHINRGWRVQHSNLLGPYKGGLRWTPGLSLTVLKSLAFEQSFKNALTGLPLGGAKGGADFQPQRCSDGEVQRFAHAFMMELGPHIGPHRDVPAGDLGVGAREIGYMAATYKKLVRRHEGALTGKPLALGGSPLRAEATGYGLVYFLCAMLAEAGEGIEGRRIAISGRGNVALHAAEKALALGGRVIALSDRTGVFEAPDGLSAEALDWLKRRARRHDDAPPGHLGLRYREGGRPWTLDVDIALPCATQNEIGAADAEALVQGGCRWLAEGANLPLTAEAERILSEAGVVQAPGKAANAGGVAVSGIEMRQDAAFHPLDPDTVDRELRAIMAGIHARLAEEARSGVAAGPAGRIDYRRAANVAAYRRLAQAMVEQGVL